MYTTTTAFTLATISTIANAIPQSPSFSAYQNPWAAHASEHWGAPSMSMAVSTSSTAMATSSWAASTSAAWTSSASIPAWTASTSAPAVAVTTATSYTNTVFVTSFVTESKTVDCGSGTMLLPSVNITGAPGAHMPIPTSLPAGATTPCSNASMTYTYTVRPSGSSFVTNWSAPSSSNGTATFHPKPVASTDMPALPTDGSDSGSSSHSGSHAGNGEGAGAGSGKPEAPFNQSESGAAEVQVAIAGVVFGFSAVVGLSMLL